MSKAAREISTNLFSFYRYIAEGCAYDHAKVVGHDYVWNRGGTWPAHLLGRPEKSEIHELAAAIREGRAPSFWVMEHPGERMLALLEKEGIRQVRQWKGMVLERKNFRAPVSRDSSAGMNVVLSYSKPESREGWLEVVNSDLMTGAQISPEFLDLLVPGGPFSWVVAESEGSEVAAGLCYEENGICGLYMIATREIYRGRGIGSNLTARLITEAFSQGSHRIILHASPLGEPLYQRLGFREVNSYSILWYLGV